MRRVVVLLSTRSVKLLILLVFIGLGMTISLFRMTTWVLAPLDQTLVGKVVAVDAGHGGIDPGSHDNAGVKEKDISLEIAKRLTYLLAQSLAVPVLTRHGDWELSDISPISGSRHRRDLDARVQIAHKTNAEILVSIHVNKHTLTSSCGPVTFYNPKSREGMRLAACIQGRLRILQPRTAQGIAAGDFYILRESKIPAAIVEVGFISNPEEKALLLSPAYRDKLAEAIFAGIKDYFAGSTKGQPQSEPDSTPPQRD